MNEKTKNILEQWAYPAIVFAGLVILPLLALKVSPFMLFLAFPMAWGVRQCKGNALWLLLFLGGVWVIYGCNTSFNPEWVVLLLLTCFVHWWLIDVRNAKKFLVSLLLSFAMVGEILLVVVGILEFNIFAIIAAFVGGLFIRHLFRGASEYLWSGFVMVTVIAWMSFFALNVVNYSSISIPVYARDACRYPRCEVQLNVLRAKIMTAGYLLYLSVWWLALAFGYAKGWKNQLVLKIILLALFASFAMELGVAACHYYSFNSKMEDCLVEEKEKELRCQQELKQEERIKKQKEEEKAELKKQNAAKEGTEAEEGSVQFKNMGGDGGTLPASMVR